MAGLMPRAFVGGVLVLRPRAARGAPLPSLVAVLLGVLPCAAWAMARWSVDGYAFFNAMWRNDLVKISTEVLEGHAGTALFYLNVLQKNQYDWLLAAAAVYVLYPVPWSRVRALTRRNVSDTTLVLGVWAVVCFLIPTAMRTKLPWYLNPLYPAFALGVGWILARGLSQYGGSASLRRGLATAAVAGALCVAEGKLVWYSFEARDVERSVQGLLIAERGRVMQAQVFKDQWSNSDVFVLEAIVRASGAVASDVDDFLLKSQPGDYLVADPGLDRPWLMLVRSLGTHALYQRTLQPASDLIVTGSGAADAPPARRPPLSSARASRGS
jgi:4-amino-4-deoxy-L-arabinose transferase-like glycosyltransferase